MKNNLLSLLFLFMSMGAWAQEFNVGNFRYVVTDNVNHYVSVAQNSENAPKGAIVIPSSVSNNAVTYTVTSIAESAFNWNTSITGVMIPNTVTSIDNYAFYGCESLASFSVPGSVTTIGSAVFDYCSIPTFTFEASNTAITLGTGIPCSDHLYLYRDVNYENTLTNTIKALTIGANVTTIYNSMFSGSYRLNSVDFSAATGLTSIGGDAFSSCGTFEGSEEEPASFLTTVDLSNTKVTSLGQSAFSYCSKLTAITLPSTLQTIGSLAFSGCSSLASFTVPGSVTTIGGGVFDYCSIPTFTFEASNTAITLGTWIPCSDHLYLYRDVNYEGTLAYAIKALTIGANVTTIYNSMFSGSYRLNSVDFSAATGLTSIGENAFSSCGTFDGSEEEPASYLTTVDLSNTKVTSLGQGAFSYCPKLTAITLPSTLQTIGSLAFSGCPSLASFTVPSSVTTIGSGVFDYCSIPTFTFEASNTAITLGSGIPCTDHLYLYRDVNYEGTLAYGMKKLTIGANVTTIYNYMFNGSNRLNSVDFSAATGLTSIGEYAFSSCGTFEGSEEEPASFLTTVDLSNTKVASLGQSAFSHCSKLTAITLPSTLTSIGDYAFSGCESLASFSVPGNVTTIGGGVFDYCSIPTFTFEAGNTAINCGSGIPCTDHLCLNRDIKIEGSLTNSIKKLTIGDAVTGIGTMFSWCNEITDVTVSWLSSPIVIADDAFADDIYANATLWIPGGTDDVYSEAAGWKKFAKNAYSNYVVSFTGSAYGTLAVGNIVSTDNETQTIRIDRESDVVFTVTPATGCELTTFTVNGAAQTVTEGQYTIKNLSADLTVKAGFKVSRYTITFDSNGGSEVTAITQDYGTAITLPDNPTRAGYEFIGWSPEVPATMPAKNMTVVAQWSDIKKCATPTIALVNNEIVFSCETTDVEFVSEVKCPDAGEYVSSSIPLTKTYIVSVYAKKEGFNDSDVAIKEINIGGTGGIRGDVNEDGEVNVGDIVVISNIMSGNE